MEKLSTTHIIKAIQGGPLNIDVAFPVLKEWYDLPQFLVVAHAVLSS
jgi:hypothetical protein